MATSSINKRDKSFIKRTVAYLDEQDEQLFIGSKQDRLPLYKRMWLTLTFKRIYWDIRLLHLTAYIEISSKFLALRTKFSKKNQVYLDELWTQHMRRSRRRQEILKQDG